MRLGNVLGLSCALLTLSTTAQAVPKIVITPPFVDFGCVGLLEPGMATITVSNGGTDALTISDFELEGPDTAYFEIPKPIVAPATLGPGMSVSFTVVYTPMLVEMDHAEIDLSTNDPTAQLVKIPLDGCGAQDFATVAPLNLMFGEVAVGTVSNAQPITITNAGGIPVEIDSVVIGGMNANQFSPYGPLMPFPLELKPMTSATIPIDCAPVSAGAFNATLTVTLTRFAPSTVRMTCNGVSSSPRPMDASMNDPGRDMTLNSSLDMALNFGQGQSQIELASSGCCNVGGKGSAGDSVPMLLGLLPTLAMMRRRKKG